MTTQAKYLAVFKPANDTTDGQANGHKNWTHFPVEECQGCTYLTVKGNRHMLVDDLTVDGVDYVFAEYQEAPEDKPKPKMPPKPPKSSDLFAREVAAREAANKRPEFSDAELAKEFRGTYTPGEAFFIRSVDHEKTRAHGETVYLCVGPVCGHVEYATQSTLLRATRGEGELKCAQCQRKGAA